MEDGAQMEEHHRRFSGVSPVSGRRGTGGVAQQTQARGRSVANPRMWEWPSEQGAEGTYRYRAGARAGCRGRGGGVGGGGCTGASAEGEARGRRRRGEAQEGSAQAPVVAGQRRRGSGRRRSARCGGRAAQP